jgi:lipid II:glycine glycyltransferase (peptidoglycan interpeptide bridge formation enzyme)
MRTIVQFEYSDTISEQKWESFLENAGNSCFFQTPRWAKILHESFGLRIATRLYSIDGIEVLIPMMEQKKFGFNILNSMPQGYGGIFSQPELNEEYIRLILKSIIGGNNILFILSLPPFTHLELKEDPKILVQKEKRNNAYILSLDTSYQDISRKKFNRNATRCIRKADKDINIFVKNDLESYKCFYSLFQERALEWGYKETPYEWKFFEALMKYGSPNVKLWLAEKNGDVIGGLMAIESNKSLFTLLMASPLKYQKYFSNHLLYRSIIEWACDHGIEYINFGSSEGYEGVRKFKESFGASKIELTKYWVSSRIFNYLGYIYEKTKSL